jgi:hypothetical protein
MLSDGSWKKADEHDKNQQGNGPSGEKKDENSNSKGDAAHDIIDLTSEENDANEPMDIEDIKPILDCKVSSTGPQVDTLQASQPRTSIFHAGWPALLNIVKYCLIGYGTSVVSLFFVTINPILLQSRLNSLPAC